MKKYIILSAIVVTFYVSLFAQPGRGERPPHSGPKPIYVEAHAVPQDSSNICYISYKVPYSNLVFVKDDLNYSTGIVFRVEVTGEGGVLARASTHDEALVKSYEETTNPHKFIEGVLSFPLNNGDATVNPLVSLDNTDRQVPLRPFKVITNELDHIVVTESKCSSLFGYKLVNFEHSIPFDDSNYKLIFPLYNSDLDKIKVSISQYEKEIISKELERNIFSQYEIEKCEQNIIISENSKNNTATFFILDQFSNQLDEGIAQLEVKTLNDSSIYSGEISVNWINKPLSLMNPKFAYELLEIIETEDELDKIYDAADSEYEDAIDLFWSEFDPDKNTPFNQLKYEFYTRADKALKEYGAKGDRFGLLTDRGKVYIKYGEPSEVNRFYSEKNEITEVWKYMSPKAQFVFVDVTGLGNYKLVN